MKPPATRCKHICASGGCDHYDKRPEGCRNYVCSWLEVDAMPDVCRPDRLGVMFRFAQDEDSWNPFEKSYVIANTNKKPEAFYSDLAKSSYQMFWNGGIPVWLQLKEAKVLIDENGREIPPGELAYYEKKLGVQG